MNLYHNQCIQHLEPADKCSRMELCHWINSNPHMILNILFTDEAHFTRDGVNNRRNSHLWDRDNPHGTVKSNYQHLFATYMWCGVTGDQIRLFIRTFYRNIWQVIFTPTFCTMHCQHSQRMFPYKHDRCTTSMMQHCLISVRSSCSIWIINSQTAGLVVVVQRIGHHGHQIWTH